MEDITTLLNTLMNDLRVGRQNVMAKGVDVPSDAGFSEVFDKVLEIPSIAGAGTKTDNSISSLKLVPINSINHCYLKSLGGMTYKDEENKVLIDTKPTAIKVHGSNILDIEVALTKMKVSYTKNGDSYTVTSLGYGENNPYKFTDTPQVCTLSVDSSSNLNYGTPRMEMGYLDENGTFTRDGVLTFGSTTTTVKSIGKVNAIRSTYSSTTGSNPSVTFTKMRLNYGTVDCGYQPYKSPVTYPIPEALQGTGRGINKTYHDSTDLETGKKKIVVGKIVYDGTEKWVLNSTSGGFFVSGSLPPSMMTNSYGLCSHFSVFKGPGYQPFPSVSAKNSSLTGTNVIWFQTYSATDERGFATVTKWTNFLKEQAALGTPVTVYWVLEEATETDIDKPIFSNIIEVEAGGSIEIITDSGKAVPTTIIYQTIL